MGRIWAILPGARWPKEGNFIALADLRIADPEESLVFANMLKLIMIMSFLDGSCRAP